jgi:RecB family exonuclease
MIRSLNRFKSIKTVNCRVISVSQAAAELYQAYCAYDPQEKNYRIAEPGLCKALFYSLLLEDNKRPGFIPKSSVSSGSSDEVLRVLNLIRENTLTAEYENAQDARTAGLKQLSVNYEQAIMGMGYIDKAILLRKVCDILRNKMGSNADMLHFLLPWSQADIAIPADRQISKKEEEFLTLLEAKSGKEFTELELEIFDPGGDQRIDNFFRSFGSTNEIGEVVRLIKEKQFMFGDVALVYAGDEYENIIRAKFENAGISYCFSKGFHASSDPHISFMRELIAFAADDYSYETLRRAVHNPALKLHAAARSYREILKRGIGWGKERYNEFFADHDAETTNLDPEALKAAEDRIAYVDFLKRVTEVFGNQNAGDILKGLLEIADSYTTKTARFRKVIREEIKNGIRGFSSVNITGDVLMMLDDYLRKLTVSDAEDEGSVLIIPYGSREVCDRKVLFAVGLGRENIERTITESPALSDVELEKYLGKDIEVAAGRNKKRREAFERMLDHSPFDHAWFSFNEYNTVSLLNNAPSQLYMGLLKKHGISDLICVKKVGYSIDKGELEMPSAVLYDAWENVRASLTSSNGQSGTLYQRNIPVELSATSLQTLMHCPLQYHYQMHERIAGEEQLAREGHSWLPRSSRGDLFHHTMEEYVNRVLIGNTAASQLDENILNECFEEQVEVEKKLHPIPSETIVEEEKKEIFDALKIYLAELYDMLKASNGKRKILACEAKFNNLPFGNYIEFSGSIDRVDGELENGSLMLYIIDYKTGNFDNLKKKIEKGEQIQHYIYAAGADQWAKANKDSIEAYFGTSFNGVEIKDVRYVFPMAEDEEKEIPVTRYVINCYGGATAGTLCLPYDAGENLKQCEEAFLQGSPQAEERIDELTINRLHDKEIGKELCEYCNYTDICKFKLGTVL